MTMAECLVERHFGPAQTSLRDACILSARQGSMSWWTLERDKADGPPSQVPTLKQSDCCCWSRGAHVISVLAWGTLNTASSLSQHLLSQVLVSSLLSAAAAAVAAATVCAVTATNPLSPANAVYNCAVNSTAGTICRATCNPGWAGSPSTTCTSTGAWTATTGACTRGGALALSCGVTDWDGAMTATVCC